MGYRTKIKHLSENNVKIAEEGELLLSSTSGHLSVKGPRGVVSRTKDLEARLASVSCVVETLQSMLDTANGETIADLTHIKNNDVIGNILEDVSSRFKDLTYKDFKLDIDAKYTAIKEMDELLKSVNTFIRIQNNNTNNIRNLNDENSTKIRDLEELFIDKICSKLNNIQHCFYKHKVDMVYLNRTYDHVKSKLVEINELSQKQLEVYMGVEYDLFNAEDIKLLNIYSDVELSEFDILESDYTYDRGYKLCKPSAEGAQRVMRDGIDTITSENQILESEVLGIATVDQCVKRYKKNDAGYMLCSKYDQGALKVIKTGTPSDDEILITESDVQDVADAGQYVKPVILNPVISPLSMSYDEFVDSAIRFIFDKHDIALYTPYIPAKK